MPLILKNKTDRATAQFAHAAAMRSTNEIVEQLQAQVKRLQCEKATLARELCEARLDLARVDSPSQAVH
jgi:multidrug resistance efflux pump